MYRIKYPLSWLFFGAVSAIWYSFRYFSLLFDLLLLLPLFLLIARRREGLLFLTGFLLFSLLSAPHYKDFSAPRKYEQAEKYAYEQLQRPGLLEKSREKISQFLLPDKGPLDSFLRRLFFLTDVYEREDTFRELGLSHLLSLSGLHVSFFYAFFKKGAGRLCIRRKTFLFFFLAFLFSYAFLLNFPPSLVRAGLMLGIREYAIFYCKRYDAWSTFFFSLLVQLAFRPYLLFHKGMWLSYGASYFIQDPLEKRRGPSVFRPAILLACFQLFFLGRVSLGQVVTNLLFIPLFEPLLGLGGVLLAVNRIPGLRILRVVGSACLEAFHFLLGLFPKTAEIRLYDHTGYLILFLLGLWIFETTSHHAGWTGSLKAYLREWKGAMLGVFLVFLTFHLLYFSSAWTLTMLDVGQGDSFLWKKGRSAVVLDTGGQAFSKERSYASWRKDLLNLGVRRLPLLLLSHADYDHVGNALLADFPVERIYINEAFSKPLFPQAQCLEAGSLLRFLDWKLISLLAAEGRNDNENSMVVRVEVGEDQLLFLGDLEARERELLEEGPISILKLGHHGTKQATGEALLDALRPQIALISCGYNNRYGHPDPSVIDRLQSRGIQILRTDWDGQVQLKWQGGLRIRKELTPSLTNRIYQDLSYHREGVYFLSLLAVMFWGLWKRETLRSPVGKRLL